MSDLYLKAVLTAFAIALVVIAFQRPVVAPANAATPPAAPAVVSQKCV